MPKILKPTLRERNRYLLVEATAEKPLDRKAVVDAVWGNLLRLHGEINAAKTSLWVMDWVETKGILKTNHKGVDTVRSSCAMIREIGGAKAALHITKVTGTLKKARESL